MPAKKAKKKRVIAEDKPVKRRIVEVVEKPAAEAVPAQAEEDLSRYAVSSDEKVPEPAKKRTIGFILTNREGKISSLRLYFTGVVVSAFVLGATAATLYFKVRENGSTKNTPIEVESTPAGFSEATPEPEATPIPRADISLEILNGSGIAGLAGKTQKTFKDLGYTVDSVGNADNNITGNQLYLDENISEDQMSNLLSDVKSKLNIEKVTSTIELDTTARIVLGSEE